MITAECSSGIFEGALKKSNQRCGCLQESARRHVHGRVAPSSTDKRLVSTTRGNIEVDRRTEQNADSLTNHASRMSEAILHEVTNQARWRIAAEEAMLETRPAERPRDSMNVSSERARIR